MSASNRYTLHKKHLPFFKAWISRKPGWIIVPPTNHTYEVFRIRKYNRQGDEPDMFFYRRDRSDHITFPSELDPLIREFLKKHK